MPLVDQAAAPLDGLSCRERWTGDDDLVFVNPVGGHVESRTLRRRFKAALRRAGLDPMRMHDLRHTFGTLAVQAFPLTDVKAFMGHADIATTMIYIHHVPQHDAAARLTRLLRERSEANVGCTAGAPDDKLDEPYVEIAQERAISALEPERELGVLGHHLRGPGRVEDHLRVDPSTPSSSPTNSLICSETWGPIGQPG